MTDPLDMSIVDLFSKSRLNIKNYRVTRIVLCLHWGAGIWTVQALLYNSERDLLKIKRFGSISLRTLKEVLVEFGLPPLRKC